MHHIADGDGTGRQDLQMYDISNAKMTTYGGQYLYVPSSLYLNMFIVETHSRSLEVPGLAEKRPSVLVGSSRFHDSSFV